MNLLVIGDDLTGCNATAILFRHLGWSVSTVLRHDGTLSEKGTGDAAQVVVWNSGTRLLDSGAAVARLELMLQQLGLQRGSGVAVQLAKRIDSTFRGPIAAETEFMLRQLPENAVAVVVAAFPSSGRTVRDGQLYVHGKLVHETEIGQDPHTPLRTSNLAELMGAGKNFPIVHLQLSHSSNEIAVMEEHITRMYPDRCIIICDAQTDEHIEGLGELFASWTRPVLTVDPGPFTVAYLAARQRRYNRVLVISGSAMPTMKRQLDYLERHTGLQLLDLHPENHGLHSENLDLHSENHGLHSENHGLHSENLDLHSENLDLHSENVGTSDRQDKDPEFSVMIASILDAFETSNVAGIRTDRTHYEPASAGVVPSLLASLTLAVLDRCHIDGLYLSGGEVAYEVLQALGAETLEPISEIEPLCIMSQVTSGRAVGLRIVTKGGAVGPEDVIAKSVQYLLAGS